MGNLTFNSHILNSVAPSQQQVEIKPQEVANKGGKRQMDIKDIIVKMSGMSREEVLLPKEREELFEKDSKGATKQNEREKGTSIYLYSNCSLQKQISKEYRRSISVLWV